MKYLDIKNNETVPLTNIPLLEYDSFLELNTGLLEISQNNHCVNYFGQRLTKGIKLFCCVADDAGNTIKVSSAVVSKDAILDSFTAKNLAFEKFEREIHENFGIRYTNHPWLKPVRYAFDRADKNLTIANYPFYSIDSEELHEVGVGPIHAGVIEPGHFRFICNGEQILHLEIQLGYQHRGIEKLFLKPQSVDQLSTLAEGIAGDTANGHSIAFAQLWESLCGFDAGKDIAYSRTLALELERMAIHTGDLSAVCTDIAYQLGSSVFGRLRTPIVNFMQEWGGNRLSKGLIRAGRNKYPFTQALAERLTKVFSEFEPDFLEMNRELFSMPSALSRFERTGVFSKEDAAATGAVGMAARASGILRDIRLSHPSILYKSIEHQPIVKNHGDVYSRVQLRKEEVVQSMQYIRDLLLKVPEMESYGELQIPQPDSFVVSLVEGWRGEICHCAITGAEGELLLYKIKDPSFHNWLALALAVRNNEISDFPICNKSFNLSYAGHDL